MVGGERGGRGKRDVGGMMGWECWLVREDGGGRREEPRYVLRDGMREGRREREKSGNHKEREIKKSNRIAVTSFRDGNSTLFQTQPRVVLFEHYITNVRENRATLSSLL